MLFPYLDMIRDYGSIGLYVSMLLEGLSLPFPGLPVILVLGGLLTPSLKDILWVAIGMSFVYSLASYVPYFIGYKFQSCINGKMADKLTKVQNWFNRYGEWSICLSRPFAVGNYVSYAAGISKTNPWRFGLLTFIGIFPWAFVVLMLATGISHEVLKLYNSF